MLKNLFTFLLVGLVVFSTIAVAQNGAVKAKKAPVIMNESAFTPIARESFSPTPIVPTAANYVAVDTMANSFGPGIGVLNPIAYDPGSNVVALVHRGSATYSTGSGTLWYNMSTDRGATWSRVAQVNLTAPTKLSRYPSMAISNPTGGDISATTGLFSWPELNPGAFGFLGYGADQPLGSNATYAVIDQGPPAYSSQVLCWVSDNTAKMYWGSDNQDDASYKIFMTEDFGTIDTFVFASSVFTDGGNVCLGGASGGGATWVAFVGTFADPNPANPIASGWYPAVSKKSATGADWDAVEVVDFRTIPALAAYDRLYDYVKLDAFVSYGGDINVDNNGYPHLLLSVTDTTVDNNSGVNAIVEVFKTATGWDGKVVFSGITDSTFTKFGGPGLGQMGPSPYLARSADGQAWVAQWVNGSPAAGDSLCDIYVSYRSVNGEWSTPMNLTETNGMNENSSHFAPMLAGTGPSYTAFSFYNYEAGYTGHDPNTSNPSVIYVAPVTVTLTDVNDNLNPNSFSLDQNFPNPFNPSTKITFSLAKAGNVSLKVFDVLGREVATLVSGSLTEGQHTYSFDASNLSSGLYVYRLESAGLSATRKMMLMK